MNRNIESLLLLTLVITSGCATVAPTQAQLPGTADCFFQASVRGWTVLDDQTLLVEAPMTRYTYLVKLFGPVTNLSFKETIGFEDGDGNGQLCSTGDSVHVGGAIPQSMPITAVRLLSAAEVTALRKPQP